MRLGLVIVAAGRGERAGVADGPKQYRKLGAESVIARTLRCFSAHVLAADTVCVIHADDQALFADATSHRTDIHTVVGGATRQASVLAGLAALAAREQPPSHVMIHDAARPFLSTGFLERIIDAISANAEIGILPALPIVETVKQAENGLVLATVPRDTLYRAQTPQTFPLAAILDVHQRAANEGRFDFTDDAALFEWAGLPVQIVDGDPANIKLTYASDFPMAETIPDIRTGNGYDVHRFGPGDHVMLCGIAIPHDQTLSGHSDADVALHALTDALLATCGAGDIGDHFPPSDPQWRGAASSIFLEHAAGIVRDNGGTILNADVTLIAEAPKIAPYREAMCLNLSALLGISRTRCSVKATTNEKMGFVGRSEGIAAIATANVHYGEHHE